MRSTAARFARVVAADREEASLHMRLELGSRANAQDGDAWHRYVAGGPNPSEASEVWIFRVEDDHPSAVRPPVEYARGRDDEQAWRRTISGVGADPDYRGAVFLRVAAVQPADEPAALPLDAPYRLVAERPFLVRVAGFNPHLDAATLRDARLVPLYDELATAVVAADETGLPADGTVDVLIEPIVAGPGWLELNVSLGVELVPAASLGWVAEPAAVSVDAAAGEPIREAHEELPDALARAMASTDPVADAAVRAFAVAREEGRLDAAARLRLLEHLRTVAPGESRLIEEEGVALLEADRHEDALSVLGAAPLDALGVRGRAALVAATLRGGRLPEPLERLRVADLARPATFDLILAASTALPPSELVRLTEFVVGRLLSEDRAAGWLAALAERALPAPHLRRLEALAANLGRGVERGVEDEP